MSANSVAPGAQEKRFAAYLDRLALAAGHADRATPLKAYCTALLLPGERKSVEPMAARLYPDKVRQAHQSLHHIVAESPWSDDDVLEAVRAYALPAMQSKGPITAWIVDDTGLVKKGRHSVGVTRQYCGQVGKQENCRVAVSLSVSTEHASLPIACRLYLPEVWAGDKKRRQTAGVPEEIKFQTKPELALAQIREAVERGIPAGVVLTDAAYGTDTRFREQLTDLELLYVVGIMSSVTVWKPGKGPLPAPPWKGMGRPTKYLRRSPNHSPLTAKDMAFALPPEQWKKVGWREGTRKPLQSRFAAVRVRPAHRDFERSEPYPEQWLLIEWPKPESEPTKYWFSTLPAETKLKELVRLAKQRWIIERDYEELKQELGLGHYEGRGWRGFHHHATLGIAAYGFLVAERSRFSPSARTGNVDIPVSPMPTKFHPRGSPRSPRAT
ncbi:MAG TPA: IS701 family transposase [Candidatus Sulfotelmatobacter sp.]|nr:IS701 family transposase [Candidatus Sulfotelmatobacter sp.]